MKQVGQGNHRQTRFELGSKKNNSSEQEQLLHKSKDLSQDKATNTIELSREQQVAVERQKELDENELRLKNK